MSKLEKPSRINALIRLIGFIILIIGLMIVYTTYPDATTVIGYNLIFTAIGIITSIIGFLILTLRIKGPPSKAKKG